MNNSELVLGGGWWWWWESTLKAKRIDVLLCFASALQIWKFGLAWHGLVWFGVSVNEFKWFNSTKMKMSWEERKDNEKSEWNENEMNTK